MVPVDFCVSTCVFFVMQVVVLQTGKQSVEDLIAMMFQVLQSPIMEYNDLFNFSDLSDEFCPSRNLNMSSFSLEVVTFGVQVMLWSMVGDYDGGG